MYIAVHIAHNYIQIQNIQCKIIGVAEKKQLKSAQMHRCRIESTMKYIKIQMYSPCVLCS
jgi:hypothetical protein